MTFIFRESMQWTAEKDDIMMKVIAAHGVFSFHSGSRERGNAWSSVATSLSVVRGFESISTSMNPQKIVRDRFTLISKHYTKKSNAEKNATGLGDINELTEHEMLLEDLIEQSKDAELRKEKEVLEKKTTAERESSLAKDIRQTAMERMGETRKRNLENQDTDDDSPNKPKSRRTSSDAINFLNLKLEANKEQAALQMEERKAEREEHQKNRESFQTLVETQMKQSSDMMGMLNQQMQQQQQQQNMMQQQMLAMMTVLTQQNKK